jgi:hypothetical protein
MEFAYITDPGHGWLLVTVDQARDVGLEPDAFTTFSYRQGDVLALEEDMDMGVFIQAYRAKHQGEPLIRAKHLDQDAWIRAWRSNY